MSSGEVTVEQLLQALERGEQQGRMKFLQFKDLIASLDKEDIARLLPEAVKLPRRQGREGLYVYLIRALEEVDPEATVRLVTETNGNIYAHYDRSLNRALYLWTRLDPEEAVDWFLNQGSQKGKENQERWPKMHQAVIAGALIEQGSSRVREILTLSSDLPPTEVLYEAFEKQSGRTERGFLTMTEEVERMEAFLPWIREFGKEKSRRSRGSRSDLLEDLLQETDLAEPTELFELLLERGQLLPREREEVIQNESERILADHFNGGGEIDWALAQKNALGFLTRHDPQNREAVFEEGLRRVLKQEHRQAEMSIERLEEVKEIRDWDLSQELQRKQLHVFPDLLERAFIVSERIQDPVLKKEALDHLNEQDLLRKEQP